VVGILNRGIFGVAGLGRPVKSVSELGTLSVGKKSKLFGAFWRQMFFHIFTAKREMIKFFHLFFIFTVISVKKK